MITVPMTELAEAQSARAPVYVYRLRWTDDDLTRKGLGTPHALDVPLVFGTPGATAVTDLTAREAVALSTTMREAWLGLVRDGVPQVPGTTWDRYEPARRVVLVLDRVCAMELDLDGDRRRSWVR